MKKMTCNQLGGACDFVLTGDTFEEIGENAKKHGMEMTEKHDHAHMEVMEKMNEAMKNPEAMQQWMEEKKKEFDSLPDEE